MLGRVKLGAPDASSTVGHQGMATKVAEDIEGAASMDGSWLLQCGCVPALQRCADTPTSTATHRAARPM